MGHEYIKNFFIQKPIQVNCGEERFGYRKKLRRLNVSAKGLLKRLLKCPNWHVQALKR
jgi:hypothetical protein